MVSKRDEKYVVYPCYFDAKASRARRRVPKDLAMKGPTAEEVAKAALALKLAPVLEKGVAHPSRPWERTGRVLVEIRGEKTALLRQLAARMKEMRGEAPQPQAAGAPPAKKG